MEGLDAESHLPSMADPESSSTSLDPAAIEAAMRVPTTVWMGSAGVLLRKLQSLAPPDLLSVDEIRLLKGLCISLKNMSEDQDAGIIARWWMKIVRELCYDVEHRLDEVNDSGGVHLDFSGLTARAKDAIERRKCFLWPPPKTTEPEWRGEAGGSRLASLVPRVVHVEPPTELVELLALDDADNTHLRVIPLNGCAGVGKTTVARALYRNHAGKFRFRAFVSVSRNPDMRGFLTSMLSQLKAPPIHGFPDVPDLIEAISKHLQGRRYFIVIDDLWTASVWNIISRAFPCGDCCSRIITTTQIDDVALACCSYDSDYMYKMKPLNEHESRKLFFGRVFGSEDGCPADIKELSYEIIRKCGGLPLAIENIARLLASESNIIMGKWKNIHDSLPSTFEGMKAVVNLMYNSLPLRLRTCLLYLSMYAHGCVIKKGELVKQWVAEGFITDVEEQDTQKTADGYFDELVSRGMVQAIDMGYNGEVLSCAVHQIVLDFIRHKSRDENFVITVDYNQSTLALPEKVRRLSVQFGGVQSAYIPESVVTSQVRSLIFWGFFKCIPITKDYGFLRVLVLQIWTDQEKRSFDLTGLGNLFLLNYLKIESNMAIKLPGNIGGLQHLETLQVDATLSAVPSDIVLLPHMLYLSLPSEADLPSGIQHMTSLRTLEYYDLSNNQADNVMELGNLTNLWDLHLTCAKLHTDNLENNMKCLGLILGELMGLKCLTLAPAVLSHVNTLNNAGASSMGICFDSFSITSAPPALERLELSRHCCIFSRLPQWITDLVNLCILNIAVGVLSMGDIDVLKGLPSLTALTLHAQTVSEGTMVVEKGGFQVLTYFKFVCAAPCLSFGQGAMSKVQKLNLGFNSNEWRSHTFETVGFSHLAGLTDVFVKFGAQDGEEFNLKAAQSALEAVVMNHRNSPIIRVQFVDVISHVVEDETYVWRMDGQGTVSITTKQEGEGHEIQEVTEEASVGTRSSRAPPDLQPPPKVGISGFFKNLHAGRRPIKTDSAPGGKGRGGRKGGPSLSSNPYAQTTQRILGRYTTREGKGPSTYSSNSTLRPSHTLATSTMQARTTSDTTPYNYLRTSTCPHSHARVSSIQAKTTSVTTPTLPPSHSVATTTEARTTRDTGPYDYLTTSARLSSSHTLARTTRGIPKTRR